MGGEGKGFVLMLLGGEIDCLVCVVVLRIRRGTIDSGMEGSGYGISLWPLFNREEFWT